ncbi:MAG: hypothetical protein R3F49_07275 [Planctomycetota bacterium]
MSARFVSLLWSTLACAASLASVAVFVGVGGGPPHRWLPALAFHVAGALASVSAGRARGASGAEADTLAVLALGLPVVGASLGWLIQPSTRRGASGALQGRSEVEVDAAQDALEHARLAIVPDRVQLADLVHVETFRSVVANGDLQARSGLVTKLTKLRGPEHMRLLRRLLDDPDEEIRIHAYESLRDAVEPLERALDEAEARAALGDAAAFAGVARAHLALATSPALDGARQHRHLLLALDVAREGRAAGDRVGTARELEALWRLSRHADASALRRGERGRFALDTPLLEAYAVAAFERREWRALTWTARALDRRGASRPAWLDVTLNLLGEQRGARA